ncbi:Golgi SNAP receptor complex member 1-2 isoform X2 [Hordeum vulgare subsp. vulgare]|uniref:Golgi SNAP receptor complex member 1-2 isoform X2 n=1 Tax=Hordeum vulgare subsp. vulgare TaxID=112509 RepID=UPI001D1A5A5B|nr:Golgi SNAP receptor complex member 1-2 isoform X2 [Hordeum vulgare subsp. vulgare]
MMHGVGPSDDAAAAAALELQESGWEELRREARKLEGDLDVKLSSYARLAARSSSASASASAASPTADRSSWKSTELEIQALLDKLQDVNDAMSRCAAPAAPSTASVTQKLARHRDILHEFTQEDAGEPELHEGARRPAQLRARRHHRVQGYRRHVAEGAFAPGEGFHSRQRQSDRRGNWASSKHKSSTIQSEGLVWRCSGKSQAVG